jgi:hypothetical protein
MEPTTKYKITRVVHLRVQNEMVEECKPVEEKKKREFRGPGSDG